MLVHAPDYAYISRYTREHSLGLVVDQDNVEALASTIREFLKNPEQGNQYIENALRIFNENHDAHQNAEKLTKLLKTIY